MPVPLYGKDEDTLERPFDLVFFGRKRQPICSLIYYTGAAVFVYARLAFAPTSLSLAAGTARPGPRPRTLRRCECIYVMRT